MVFNYIHRKHLIFLWVFLSLHGLNAFAQKENPVVYDIRFGDINPPVAAQKNITVQAPISNQQTETKALECSGLAWMDGHLLITSDRHKHLLFTCPVDLDTMEIGTPNNGGAVITAGGLIFIAAATDNLMRAIDVKTGTTLWQAPLPAGGQANPMVYEIGGRQYLVIMAGGHHFMGTTPGDYVIAYTLPR